MTTIRIGADSNFDLRGTSIIELARSQEMVETAAVVLLGFFVVAAVLARTRIRGKPDPPHFFQSSLIPNYARCLITPHAPT